MQDEIIVNENDAFIIKEFEIIDDEEIKSSEIFKNETDILKTELMIKNIMNRIFILQEEYKNIKDAPGFCEAVLTNCRYRLAYIYKCKDEGDSYNEMYEMIEKSKFSIPNEILDGRSFQQFFENKLLWMALEKKTIWNGMDKYMQHEALEMAVRGNMNEFASKLGLDMSFSEKIDNFCSALEFEINKKGISDVIQNAKKATFLIAEIPYYTIEEDAMQIRIKREYRLGNGAIEVFLVEIKQMTESPEQNDKKMVNTFHLIKNAQ